ncbi:aminoglycoside phosphotransferase family protein [Actinokineospora cianjurensis]|uniref:Streptomycin 6-kinase n=1 Tax=Actinokineospora cianjurensis TaxID=585224 RepID=A0A421B2I0_9PSEU|nr:aminoglycoside phosphotransferase family protein [Actinokineospora cianjurensis]RLK58555.1 streptomycin 6-kinase [Actinokineospora cianjurensis]
MPIPVPDALAAYYAKQSPEHLPWLRALPTLADTMLDRWSLKVDGPARHGMVALVIPVVRPDRTPAVLKLQPRDEENDGEPLALRHWAGNAAVHLLDHDEPTGSMLLERLIASRPLSALPASEGIAVIADLLSHLHVPAPPGIRTLTDIATAMLAERPLLNRLTNPSERTLAITCADATAAAISEPGNRLLHWDLHYDNVLASSRTPWLAIDPKPISGHPAFDLMPALDNNFHTPTDLLHRFDHLTESLSLDRPTAAAWTLARTLQNTLWSLHDGDTTLDPVQAAIAQTLLSR